MNFRRCSREQHLLELRRVPAIIESPGTLTSAHRVMKKQNHVYQLKKKMYPPVEEESPPKLANQMFLNLKW